MGLLGCHNRKGPVDLQHEVDSIEETISKATNIGAMLVRDKMKFDDFYLAYLVDPTGLGLIQKKNNG